MKIALVSEHASPLAVLDGRLGGSEAGGQNVHVAALAGALADRGHQVVVYTRREFPDQPASVPMRPGVDVVHVQAHLDDCPHCLHLYQFHASLRRLVQIRCQEQCAPTALKNRVIELLARERAKRASRRSCRPRCATPCSASQRGTRFHQRHTTRG